MSSLAFRISISLSRAASSSLNFFSTAFGSGPEKYSSSCWPKATWDREKKAAESLMTPKLECPPLPPSSGTQAPGSHHSGLASAQLPSYGHLERSLMKIGQCCHHCLQCRILGGRWGQPHRAGCVRDPSIPIQLRRGRYLESMSAKHKNPLATCTQPPPPLHVQVPSCPPPMISTWPRWTEECWPVQVKMHMVTKWQTWSWDCKEMGNPAKGKES